MYFADYFVSLPFPLCMGGTMYILPDGVFLPCDHGLNFDISLCENSINEGGFIGLGYVIICGLFGSNSKRWVVVVELLIGR